MRTSFHDLWGSARGPVKRLAPPTRVVAGALAFAACMVVPAATGPGALLVASVVSAWVAVCRPPFRLVLLAALLGLALFLPYFALVPLLAVPEPAGAWQQALVVPWTVLVRGLGGMLLSLATVTSLTAGDLREAMVRLPVPGMVSAILLQIVHQTATLFYETRRVSAAMAVRGASGRGSTGLRLLSSLPQVWLPRVVDRAERVSTAMELRGYCDRDTWSLQSLRFRFLDSAALALASGTLALAVVLRLWGAA